MSEAIYLQVEHAIGNNLHLGRDRPDHWLGMTWDRPVKIALGDIWITRSDCGRDSEAHPISPAQWAHRVETMGLWHKVGVWEFVRYPDPAVYTIYYCELHPVAAGRELYRLRGQVRRDS